MFSTDQECQWNVLKHKYNDVVPQSLQMMCPVKEMFHYCQRERTEEEIEKTLAVVLDLQTLLVLLFSLPKVEVDEAFVKMLPIIMP